MHGVKRSVCPKQKVHTSHSDLSHSTAKVKPHYPPLSESQTQLSPVVKKLGPRGAGWCAVSQSQPHFWSAAEGFPPGQSEKVTTQFFEICSDHRQTPTRSAENQLKMPPKLSRLQPCCWARQCYQWIFFRTIWVVLEQIIWHNAYTEPHERLCDSLPTPPLQLHKDLTAAPTLPGLANRSLKGVRLAR